MPDPDIRWLQRLSNFNKAFNQLDSAVQLCQTRELSDLEKQGLIQAFEYTYELAWNVIRDYFRWQGNTGITGSRDAIREAFANGLVEDGDDWMRMLQDRNRTSHTYNEDTARAILNNILAQHHSLFKKLRARMDDEVKKHGLA
ncbi:nucleotidyltransferase substrate binding protein [Marinobacter subterrani]|uniref:Nucleotidyltransferase substrate binding protein, HI0074 family n=1 Tax=Marinobacter subterrani TaxID=1658765 RepID=A0A0J7JAY9_9GAMM|nr:nucleotidyltransferase substrate binding protein [Marinobacter subterrani]KMQ75623.1 nucleotidyltransferase substrate binding protein, HI0074 family [Marinobacter subterrani]